MRMSDGEGRLQYVPSSVYAYGVNVMRTGNFNSCGIQPLLLLKQSFNGHISIHIQKLATLGQPKVRVQTKIIDCAG